MKWLKQNDVIGFIRPSIDAHTLGINYAASLLEDCGYRVIIADRPVAEAVNQVSKLENSALISRWIIDNNISVIGFSYRLDPKEGLEIFSRFYHQLRANNLNHQQGGPVRSICFAGLPETCRKITRNYGREVKVFCGDESTYESLLKFGVPEIRIKNEIKTHNEYDSFRLDFGEKIISAGDYLETGPVDRSGYPEYGTFIDHVVKRINHGMKNNFPPLMRVHIGPYSKKREEALKLLSEWLKILGRSGLLDIVSLGTSQLTQSNFGEDWGDKPNGGGVPINSEDEYNAIWKESRPMLVRTYAGTNRITELADLYERSINCAWHAFSFWWFSQIDGRGPNSVFKNLEEHLNALRLVAARGKPFEPNIPHHFAFRGSDDVTYILSAYLAARTAKKYGVNYLILQNMLNTPRYVSGIQDLARSRAMLRLVRELEDNNFHVILQPRAGLDYFSADMNKARKQLASVTALMDDIEPLNAISPHIIHVVSYSEARRLADPPVIDESIRIVRTALTEYRKLRAKGNTPHMADHQEITDRAERLYSEACAINNAIHDNIKDPYSPEGLYLIFAAGFLPAPNLWECREEYIGASNWKTDLIDGEVKIVTELNRPMSIDRRIEIAVNNLEEIYSKSVICRNLNH